MPAGEEPAVDGISARGISNGGMAMRILPINNNNNIKFDGQLKLNTRNMDIIDVNLFKYHSSDICEFVQKQKYDYKIEKAFNQIHVLLEENGKNLNEQLVIDYVDGNGHKHLKKVLEAIKSVTERQNNIDSYCNAKKI